MRVPRATNLIVCCLIASQALVSRAEESAEPNSPKPDSSPIVLPSELDEFAPVVDTSSPRSTLQYFIETCNLLKDEIEAGKKVTNEADRRKLVQLLECLDVSDLPLFNREERAGEVTACLKEIIDRLEIPPWDRIPDVAAIEAAGGFERVPFWRLPGSRITITRIDEGPRKYEYLFSSGTVNRAVDYYNDLKARPYRTTGPPTTPGLHTWYVAVPRNQWVASIVAGLPDNIRFGKTLGLTNWKWPGLLLVGIIGVAAMTLCYRLQWRTGALVQDAGPIRQLATLVFPISAMLVPLGVEAAARDVVSVRGTPLYVVSFLSIMAATLAGVVVAFVLCSRVAAAVIASPQINPAGLNAQLIRIAARLVSVVLAVVVLMVGGQYLGIPVATLLASAGIGGVALALGAQDTLKTLFGTLMLMADKPFRVGDRIIFRDYDGVVEDIGLRSTRLRLLTSHLVTIPNDELARSDIENVGRRERIRRVFDIAIPLETPSSKVERAVEIIRSQLADHEGLDEDFPPRVHFLDIDRDAFLIRVMYWYHPADYWAFLAFGERINLAVLNAMESEDIAIALPERLTLTSSDTDVPTLSSGQQAANDDAD